MSAAEQWLRSRAEGAPSTLLERMAAELSDADGAVPEALAAAAVRLYGSVLNGPSGRECALPLLAADALLTHALHAQAEADVSALGDFARRWGAAGELAALSAGHTA